MVFASISPEAEGQVAGGKHLASTGKTDAGDANSMKANSGKAKSVKGQTKCLQSQAMKSSKKVER